MTYFLARYRDWRGIAELAGMTSEDIMYLESKGDPTTELIRSWVRQESRRTTDDLRAFLAVIDRFDISDDISPLMGTLALKLDYW